MALWLMTHQMSDKVQYFRCTNLAAGKWEGSISETREWPGVTGPVPYKPVQIKLPVPGRPKSSVFFFPSNRGTREALKHLQSNTEYEPKIRTFSIPNILLKIPQPGPEYKNTIRVKQSSHLYSTFHISNLIHSQ